MKFGIFSDTHNLLRPEVLAALSDVDAILHAIDISSDHAPAGVRTNHQYEFGRRPDRDPVSGVLLGLQSGGKYMTRTVISVS